MVTTVTIKDRTPVSVPVSTSASDPSEVVRLPALVLVLAAVHRHMVMVVSPYPYDIFNPSTAMAMGVVVSTTVVVSTVETVPVEVLYQYSCLRPPYYYWRVSIGRCRVVILIMVIIFIVLLGAVFIVL
jgi:hypothetical protein